ncbi:hypothetical protein DEIGR_200203 [Deinococcus grandis]|uniref:Spore coat protein U domain-containing protein n=1 Tax=Deinococcus grandis TaxID=57498 RepID=A0A100HMD2_9DEIO|nr:hypothetical protein [Deinococcus grandis]BBN96684.1 hypothetical protein DEGR_34170 [Deinococcus grandis]GAQ23348.1 hypothetical protein DEIGR_200203 [Deinococcus grandis]
MRRYSVLFPLLLLPAQAAGTPQTVQVGAQVNRACVIATANQNPKINMGDYDATVSYGTNFVGEVTIDVYCNRGSSAPTRKINGSAVALNYGTALTTTLTRSAGGTLDSRVWMVHLSTSVMNDNASPFNGAQVYPTKVRAGWPSTPQFNAPSGQYAGSVVFSVEF